MPDSKEYLVRGAKLQCAFGSHIRKLNLPQDHGAYTKNGLPMIHEEDCVAGKNISSFGICQRPGGEGDIITLEVPLQENYSNGPMYQPSITKAPKVLTGPACVPELLSTTWEEAHEKVVIDDGGHKKTVTSDSFLICKHFGGIITVVTSGQEQEQEPDEKDNLEEKENEARRKNDEALLACLKNKSKQGMNPLMRRKGLLSEEMALNAIQSSLKHGGGRNNEAIEIASKTFDVPKSYIQAILMRELMSYDVRDLGADFLVGEQKSVDSSTGIAQMFASTSLKVKHWYKTGEFKGVSFTEEERYEEWLKLEGNEEYDIMMLGMKLAWNIANCKKEDPNFNMQDPDYIRWVFAKYNRDEADLNGNIANDYGQATYLYQQCFGAAE